ncbi:hypothetical protein GCM10022240_22860 [Microbacterium kribbense]|uniref:Uncharacterized protein n=1 Tax=Microbacterium kribbense TaxID=433645 RepID=A0ABP7GNS8_9MICO
MARRARGGEAFGIPLAAISRPAQSQAGPAQTGADPGRPVPERLCPVQNAQTVGMASSPRSSRNLDGSRVPATVTGSPRQARDPHAAAAWQASGIHISSRKTASKMRKPRA